MLGGMRHKAVLVLGCVLVALVMACGDRQPLPDISGPPTPDGQVLSLAPRRVETSNQNRPDLGKRSWSPQLRWDSSPRVWGLVLDEME